MKQLSDSLATELNPDKEAIILEQLSSLTDTYNVLKQRISKAEKAMGIRARQQLGSNEGKPFLAAQDECECTRIRGKLIARKFERASLERAYHHQVMSMFFLHIMTEYTDKIHARGQGPSTNQNSAETRSRAAPAGAHIPSRLDTAELFRLDIDDDIFCWILSGKRGMTQSHRDGWLMKMSVRAFQHF